VQHKFSDDDDDDDDNYDDDGGGGGGGGRCDFERRFPGEKSALVTKRYGVTANRGDRQKQADVFRIISAAAGAKDIGIG